MRIEAPADDALKTRVESACAREGASVRFGDAAGTNRAYALVEGPESVDRAAVAQALPEARWFDHPIIALAIEPRPPDALPLLVERLGGSGAPAGVLECAAFEPFAIVEFDPNVTPASLIFTITDAELRRFAGSRTAKLLSPLPPPVTAQVAADGLNCAEIASDRILETLLERARVE